MRAGALERGPAQEMVKPQPQWRRAMQTLYTGLDAHKASISIALAPAGDGPARKRGSLNRLGRHDLYS